MCQLVINKLSKSYGKNTVINNLSCTLESKNYIFLIGENGTGKSTLIKCLLGYTSYQGEIIKDELKFSYAPEKISLPDYITVYNLLLLLATSKKLKYQIANQKINEYLNHFAIQKYRNTPICKLSKGTKQKVILIQTLIDEADVYIFDEPLSGLDEMSRKCFIEQLKKLKHKEKLIIISTHHINDYKFRYKKIIEFPINEVVIND